MLVTTLFVCGGQVICVVGLSFVHNSSEMNVRVGAYRQFGVGNFGENMAFDKIWCRDNMKEVENKLVDRKKIPV